MTPVRIFRAALVAFAVGLAGCGSDGTGPGARYPQAEAHGLDPGALEEAYDGAGRIPGIRSLLVQRHGVLIAEEYFHGARGDSLYQVWSVTKTMMSILTGMALERGDLEDLDQTLSEFLGPVVDSLPEDKGSITVRNLLTMTCGLEWHELDGGGQYSTWVGSPDMIQYVIDLPWVRPPGEAFHYHTGCTHLLSVVLTEAVGEPLLDFAREHLLAPLGIEEAEWWTDERGYFTGGMGLFLKPRDMMRIGELYLREGVWEGRQIVPTAWVRESTAPQLSTGGAIPHGSDYGYLWWVGQSGGRRFYFANGYGGQFIFVSPALDLVVVATSTWRSMTWDQAGEQWGSVIDVVVNGVIPSARP